MTPPHGDRVPEPLGTYWQALDSGLWSEAAACFSSDAVYALPSAGTAETAPRAVTVGSAAIRRRFEERGPRPWHHVPLLCVADERDALVEGVLHDPAGDPVATYVCSARIDGRLIERYLAFSCLGALDPIPTSTAAAPVDAAAVVHDYFAALDEGRFEDAAARFSEDVLYSHPPYQHTGIEDPNRVEFRGRPALHRAFLARGRTSFDHEVVVSLQRGPHCMLEGAVRDLPGGGSGSFISSLSLADGGTIARYVSFYCEPGIPTRR